MVTGVNWWSLGAMRACEATAGISQPDVLGICMASTSAWNFARSSSHTAMTSAWRADSCW
ncbi:unnamed protein product [Ectocarpus sp. 6 AP-2014]